MTAHFHLMGTAGGSEIIIKEGDKIILEGIKSLIKKDPSTQLGKTRSLVKLRTYYDLCRFVGDLESIEEFESKCAALDGKKTLFGDE